VFSVPALAAHRDTFSIQDAVYVAEGVFLMSENASTIPLLSSLLPRENHFTTSTNGSTPPRLSTEQSPSKRLRMGAKVRMSCSD
jgi:hypothetical protein